MANYATNIFYAKTECSKDLDTIEAFLEYPEEEISKLIASLANKDKVYIKILSYEFDSDYVSFRIFSQGKWNVKL